MTIDLLDRAMQMAINLRVRGEELIFHSDRDSQYTSKLFSRILKRRKIKTSMSGVGDCWGNAVVERFLGSLKHE